MDPVLQIFQQQQGGSANGEGFGGFAVQGRQLNLAQQRIDLDRKAESRMQREQDVLLPIRQKILQYDALNRGIEMGALLTDADVTSEMNAFLPKVNELMVKFMRSPKGFSDDALINEYQQLYSRNPWAFSAGNGAKIKQGMDAQMMQRDNWIKVLEHDKQLQERGLYIRGYNPKTGDIDVGLREQATAASSTSDIKNQQFETALQSRIRSLPVGSPERIQAEEELSQFRAKTMPRGTIIRQNADGSTEIIQGAPTGGDMTTAQEGTARIQAQRLTDTARRINEIIPMADQIFGPKAAIGTVVVDRTLANLVPGLIEGQRVEGRAKAGLVIEGLIRNLSEGQGALSNQDVKRLQAKFPELNNPEELIESPARAKIILKAIQKEVARDAYGRQRLIGSTIDAETLQFLDPTFLVEEYQRGRITKEQLSQAIESSPYVDEINDRIAKSRKGR